MSVTIIISFIHSTTIKISVKPLISMIIHVILVMCFAISLSIFLTISLSFTTLVIARLSADRSILEFLNFSIPLMTAFFIAPTFFFSIIRLLMALMPK